MIGIMNRFRDYLPITTATPILTLGEGNTPLIPVTNLARSIGLANPWYVKFEGMNPTGSFKDRGMVMAIAKAKEAGSQVVICASTGNTSASAAAYAARAGLACIVLIPDGKIALGKLAQAMVHGAAVLQIDGNFDDALTLVREAVTQFPITLVNSVNPFRIEGQKTGSFEIIDVLGDAPAYHTIPVGNAGNITAYWKGYCEYHGAGKSTHLPQILGFQASGAAPFLVNHPIDNPTTIATAIQIGNPASWDGAIAARDESGGRIDAVSDDDITQAQISLAKLDGIFCEPASAASVAGVIAYHKNGYFTHNGPIVSVLTGHGLKDPQRAISITPPPTRISATMDGIQSALDAILSQRR